ncbi:hypothetical protein Tco_0854102 [Tanacetum coccineum]
MVRVEEPIQTLRAICYVSVILDFEKVGYNTYRCRIFIYNNSYQPALGCSDEVLYGRKVDHPKLLAKCGLVRYWRHISIHGDNRENSSNQEAISKPPEIVKRAIRLIRFRQTWKSEPLVYWNLLRSFAKVGTAAYRLELPEKLSRVHSTFHVSKLKKYMADEPLAIPLDEIQVDDKLNFIKEPVEIMDREVKRLKQSRIPIVKVRRNSQEESLSSAGS